MSYKAILKIIPTLQATALASDNIKFYKKSKKKSGDFVSQGVKNIIGAELTSETANITESFWLTLN